MNKKKEIKKQFLDKDKVRLQIFLHKTCVVDLAKYCKDKGCKFSSQTTFYNIINEKFPVKKDVLKAICERFSVKPKNILKK